MKSYDLYLYDEDQEAVIGWHSFQQQNDEAAFNYADALAQGAPMELWQGETLLRAWARPSGTVLRSRD